MGMTEGITINHKVKSNSSELAQVSLLVRELMGRKNVGTFSNEAGLSRGYVSRLINNKLKSKPSIRTLAKIAYTSGDKEYEIFSELLNICGYTDIIVEEKENQIRIAKREARVQQLRRNNEDVEIYEGIDLKASAMGLLFTKFLMMGVSVKPMGSFDPDEAVEFGITGFKFERIVAIPAFCGKSNQEIMAERDVLQRLLKSISLKREHTPLYLVMTDNANVFDYISKLINELENILAYILKADKEGTKFIEQKFYDANEGTYYEDVLKFVE